jgi:hypothetical protein
MIYLKLMKLYFLQTISPNMHGVHLTYIIAVINQALLDQTCINCLNFVPIPIPIFLPQPLTNTYAFLAACDFFHKIWYWNH